MIKLGFDMVPIYQNKGFYYENHGGNVIFKGRVAIGNGGGLSVGKNGILEIGDNVSMTTNNKVICWDSTKIMNNVWIGWNSLITDTSFHSVIDLNTNKRNRASLPVTISNGCWIAANCTILPGASMNSESILAAGSILNKNISERNVLIAGIPPKIVRKNVVMDAVHSIYNPLY